jgi:hypothetical protein
MLGEMMPLDALPGASAPGRGKRRDKVETNVVRVAT